MLREEGCCRVTGFALDRERLKKMVLIGLPAGLQGTLFSLSNVIIQSSLEAVDKGEIEAAIALGMTGPQRMFRIILPEATWTASCTSP